MENEQLKSISSGDAIPVPTSPPLAPTFEPPKAPSKFNGSACHYHRDETAVEKCARCGKHICQDCFDNYGVSSGDYEGQALCYDCCRELVAENVAELTKNKKEIKFHFILSIIGMSIGFILGMILSMRVGIETGGLGYGFSTGLINGIIFAGIGGVFPAFMKFYLHWAWDFTKKTLKAIFSGGGMWAIVVLLMVGLFQVSIEVFKCLFYTIKNTIDYIKYLKETQGFIESDSAALQQMADYMEYTMIRNQNRGVDIETLLNEKSELASNSYAQMVYQRGEEGAEAALRDCVASINENGEIIRNFNVSGRAVA